MRDMMLASLATTAILVGAFLLAFWTVDWQEEPTVVAEQIDPWKESVECKAATESFFRQLDADSHWWESEAGREATKVIFEDWTRPFCAPSLSP